MQTCFLMKTVAFYKKIPLSYKKHPFLIKKHTWPTYKKTQSLIWPFIKKLIFQINRDPWLQGQGGAPPGDDGGNEDEMDKDELWASSPLQISAPHLKDTSSSAPWGRAGDCRQDDCQVIKVGSLSQRLYLQN